MLPVSAAANMVNQGKRHREALRHNASRFLAREDFHHGFGGQLRSRVIVPLDIAEFRHLVRVVVGNRADKQVCGLHARRVVAVMESALTLFKQSADLPLQDGPMEACIVVIGCPQATVPVRIAPTSPNQAIAFGLNTVKDSGLQRRETARFGAELGRPSWASNELKPASRTDRGTLSTHPETPTLGVMPSAVCTGARVSAWRL
jgi:hypothetical protein